MGLFSKEPAEKKAYDKALIAMLSKPNAKTMAAMEDASAKWLAAGRDTFYWPLLRSGKLQDAL